MTGYLFIIQMWRRGGGSKFGSDHSQLARVLENTCSIRACLEQLVSTLEMVFDAIGYELLSGVHLFFLFMLLALLGVMAKRGSDRLDRRVHKETHPGPQIQQAASASTSC